MTATDYPLLNIFLSILWFFLLVIWFFAVAAVIIDVFRSRDMSGGAKALWFVFVLFLPLIGLLSYLVVRGPKMQQRAMHDAQAEDEAMRSYVRDAAATGSTADEINKLVDLRDRGAITPAEYEKQKAVLLR